MGCLTEKHIKNFVHSNKIYRFAYLYEEMFKSTYCICLKFSKKLLLLL